MFSTGYMHSYLIKGPRKELTATPVLLYFLCRQKVTLIFCKIVFTLKQKKIIVCISRRLFGSKCICFRVFIVRSSCAFKIFKYV